MRKMKQLLIILAFLPISLLVNGQENQFDNLIEQGIEFHDLSEYDKAIEKYNEALEIQPNSSLAYYQISYSYLVLQDYKNALKYSKLVIDNNNGHELHAHIVYGTALDMLGKTKKSIKAYEKALKEYDHYLLHYNHAISCFNSGELDKAYESALNAIMNNASHASSHLLLSNIMEKKGSRIKTVLPLYFFLVIEPNSARSNSVYQMLVGKLGFGVEETSKNNIHVSIPLNESEDPYFGAAEMMISLSRASNYTEDNAGKTDMELFAENNQSIFSILGELKKDNEGFWWEFYVPFLYDIAQNNHTKAYSYYISQSSGNQEVQDWFKSNEEEYGNFLNWMND